MTFLFFVGRHITFEIKWNFNRIRTNAEGNANHCAYLCDTIAMQPIWITSILPGSLQIHLSVYSYLMYAIEIDDLVYHAEKLK